MSKGQVRCTKCGHVAPWEEWPKGRDFFQKPFVSHCLNPQCKAQQSPGDASLRMMPGMESPFVFVRPKMPAWASAVDKTLDKAREAS